jgi:hypothetical protein
MNDRCNLRGPALPQPRPKGLIFGMVMLVQDSDQEINVIRDYVRAIPVARPEVANQCGQQPELSPEHGVNSEHPAGVGVRAFNS